MKRALDLFDRQSDKSLRTLIGACLAWILVGTGFTTPARSAEDATMTLYRERIQPLLVDYCYGCHGEGAKKGEVAFDGFMSDEALLKDRNLWAGVLKNVRAGIMPPANKPRPTAEDVRVLEDWVKQGIFGLDLNNPDPGRVTLRRLNRVEYRNTIRDLMGYDFKAEEEFPPDDTGYGFDNIGDVLTLSPLLLEKYMRAAEAIVMAAVPTISRMVETRTIPGSRFRGNEGAGNGDRMSFYDGTKVSNTFKAGQSGRYKLVAEISVRGDFNFDPGRCRFKFKADDHDLFNEEFGWQDGKKRRLEFTEQWDAGDHRLDFELEPLTPRDQKKTSVDMRILSVQVEGPLEEEKWTRPKNFDRFFSENDPKTLEGRRRYSREVLNRFASKAFRRPAEARTVDRLLEIAESIWTEPGKSVEQGLARAMVAVLSSPRFLFRVETTSPQDVDRDFGRIDEYALASRLSYFLWSTMPDDELIQLAAEGKLRTNLKSQVERLLADDRSRMLIENFTGQWLQARDLEGIAIDSRIVLARDNGEEKDLQRETEEFRAFLAEREKQRQVDKEQGKQAQPQGANRGVRGRFTKLFGKPKVELDGPLRLAMRRETEMFFNAIVREDRSVLDLLDSDFTYLNERLATLYGIPDVKGEEMRRVSLPEGSPRGGILTQGTVLVVTSNPTRTSPVKRGLFILDNIVGSPPPPPPPDIPQLEDAEKAFKDREPSLREVLELHRSKPLCHSCHSRMDPLGLALENFNALGMWRDKERNQSLDTQGQLITGEKFAAIRDLKRILRQDRRADFYRCLSEKFLTYALGRGMEYYDVVTVDQIAQRLETDHGKFSSLLMGVIESAPFQKRRNATPTRASATD